MSSQEAGGSTNKGIQQYGGTMKVGVQVIGDRAHAQAVNVHQSDPLAVAGVMHLLETVHDLIKQHQDTLLEASNAVTTTDMLRKELSQDEPRKSVIMRLLAHLAELVSPIKPVAEAVTELIKATSAIFGSH
jgi:hypothetical protein